ncbi:MAG TPA: hypothetical protein ENJ15_00985 [Caldithrix abyssi]|uniref:Uncharacterized protein n=1 Tax=Caldithrix abyssi TaxID=187145 RepID=A0A7V5RN25_CALAY|nr:hypothetical protein [Caldithrix abyssi]
MQHFINERRQISGPSEIQLRQLTDEEREDFEERAAIMEYDGGLERALAETLAWQRIVAGRVPLAG